MQVEKIQTEAIHSYSRSPSPWDKFSASPSPRLDGLEIEMRRGDGIPKLAPEIEQGNVEYKLILKNPSAERLHRLVTQLNWRLMEGNGQAYYQLGVADSGDLVGLTREEMEATLETLENMAGELGATVVISREIEVRGRLTGLVLESVNGMGDEKPVIKASGSPLSTSMTSTDASGTDTETSDADATDETDGETVDSPTVEETTRRVEDPDEIIVRSAPVPITHSFLRRMKEKNGASKGWQKEKTIKPEDFLPPTISSNEPDDDADTEGDAHDPDFGLFNFSDIQSHLPPVSSVELDATRPAKSKPKGPKPSKPPRRPKGAKAPTGSAPVPKTSEQIAQKMAEKYAKRDKRREQRRRALMDPIYDSAQLSTQDGESKIYYDSLVIGDAEDSLDVDEGMLNSLATLKQEDVTPAQSNSPAVVSTTTPVIAVVDLAEDETSATSTAAAISREQPRLIVEALVVRKAGFGRGFVDLSQFDEELRHLPSFSLS